MTEEFTILPNLHKAVIYVSSGMPNVQGKVTKECKLLPNLHKAVIYVSSGMPHVQGQSNRGVKAPRLRRLHVARGTKLLPVQQL